MRPRTGSLSLPDSCCSWKVLESCHRGRHSLAFLWPKFPGYTVGDRCPLCSGALSAGTWGSPPGVGEACPTPTPHLVAPQGRLVLSNKMARTIGFFYTLFLHCLVFLVSIQAGGQGPPPRFPDRQGQPGSLGQAQATLSAPGHFCPLQGDAEPTPQALCVGQQPSHSGEGAWLTSPTAHSGGRGGGHDHCGGPRQAGTQV